MTSLLKQLTSNYLIGFTATPDYRSAKHLPELYKDIVIGPQPDELVQMGFLSSYKHFERKAANLSGLQMKGGDFTEQSQEKAFETKAVYDGLIEDLRKIPYRKCLIFTSSINHCIDVATQLTENGFNCVEVHSRLERANESYNMMRFHEQDVNICVSVGVLTKGYDFPAIDLVVLQRATTSLPLYLQMIGRGSRLFPSKSFFTVLDYGQNCTRLLPWDFEREWSEMWNKGSKKKKKDGVAPIKTCPECDYMMPASASKCPDCGFIFEKEEKEKTPIETELIEVTENYRKLIGCKILDLAAPDLATYAKAKNKKGFASLIARSKGDDYLKAFAAAIGYKPGWVYMQRKQYQNEELDIKNFILR